jgi:GST-like protein
MNQQLTRHRFIAGSRYSIADMAIFPWLRSWQNQGIDWADYPALKKWFDGIAERPAVKRGVAVLADLRKPLTDDKARDVLFGKAQYQKR